jgi:hypothetical protein
MRLHRWQTLPRWRSRTRWPFCKREEAKVITALQRGGQIGQKNPTAKQRQSDGVVGQTAAVTHAGTWLIRDHVGYWESTRCRPRRSPTGLGVRSRSATFVDGGEIANDGLVAGAVGAC